MYKANSCLFLWFTNSAHDECLLLHRKLRESQEEEEVDNFHAKWTHCSLGYGPTLFHHMLKPNQIKSLIIVVNSHVSRKHYRYPKKPSKYVTEQSQLWMLMKTKRPLPPQRLRFCLHHDMSPVTACDQISKGRSQIPTLRDFVTASLTMSECYWFSDWTLIVILFSYIPASDELWMCLLHIICHCIFVSCIYMYGHSFGKFGVDTFTLLHKSVKFKTVLFAQ